MGEAIGRKVSEGRAGAGANGLVLALLGLLTTAFGMTGRCPLLLLLLLALLPPPPPPLLLPPTPPEAPPPELLTRLALAADKAAGPGMPDIA